MSRAEFWLRWLLSPKERERMQSDYLDEHRRLAESENPLHAVLEELETKGLFLRKLPGDAVPPTHLLGRLERRGAAANSKLGSDCPSASPQAPVLPLSLRPKASHVQSGPVRVWNVVLSVGPGRDHLLARRSKLRGEYQEALRRAYSKRGKSMKSSRCEQRTTRIEFQFGSIQSSNWRETLY